VTGKPSGGLTLTPTEARRLAVARQRLAGPAPGGGAAEMLALVRELGCLQLDPISVVARSHLLVLFSRLGRYDPATLDALMWRDRSLFEYWAHCASIVPTSDYPLHRPMMERYGATHSRYGATESSYNVRLREWVAANDALRRHILERLEREGPLPSKRFEGDQAEGWLSTGWTNGRNVSRMLDYLWIKGEIMVAGRAGGQKLWDLAARCLPADTPTAALPERELVRQAAQRSLRALGVARSAHIQRHFIRGRYPGLTRALADLAAEGRIVQARIVEDGRDWPGPWHVHADDLPLLDRLARGDWEPRTTLLSPFDNLICDRDRTEALFDFRFRIEIYVPKAKREYGYYVLPVLQGDRLIGRVDPAFDRTRRRLVINAIHTEPGAPAGTETRRAIAGAIEDLAAFLGARAIDYPTTATRAEHAAG
jgi:uncharacterized protein YcaQ